MEGITYVLYMYLRGLITGIEKVCLEGGGAYYWMYLSHCLISCSLQFLKFTGF